MKAFTTKSIEQFLGLGLLDETTETGEVEFKEFKLCEIVDAESLNKELN